MKDNNTKMNKRQSIGGFLGLLSIGIITFGVLGAIWSALLGGGMDVLIIWMIIFTIAIVFQIIAVLLNIDTIFEDDID
jgi:predicted lipid-binding transport protein (Tim44 family)